MEPPPSKEDEVPLFRRRRGDAGDDDEIYADDLDTAGDGDASGAAPEPVTTTSGPTSGPWDVADVADELPRIDLGALQIPVPDGCEVRVDVQNDQVVSATLVDGRSALQIHAFAAPRSEGIWQEVRQEISESLRSSGGAAEEADGPFGPELRARIPVPPEAQGQGQHPQPARFIGVDGPRWFLRGLITGVASTDPNQARVMEEAFRNVVVVRGGEAMAPRDLLPLRLPREAQQHLEAQQAEQEAQKPTLEMLQRGPEITETR
jgi:hypothetical protein